MNVVKIIGKVFKYILNIIGIMKSPFILKICYLNLHKNNDIILN